MRQFSRILVFLTFAVFLVAGTAMATSISLGDLTGYSGYDTIYDTGAEAVILTDTDGVNDSAVAFLYLEASINAAYNSFGIYGYSYDEYDQIVLGETLEIFEGSDVTNMAQTLYFDVAAGLVSLNSDMTDYTDLGGTSFGFYINNGDNIYYSHADLNDDGIDYMLLFDTSDVSTLAADVVVAIEDGVEAGEFDYYDMVVGVSDVAPVPEPATMLLFGSGLIGLGAFGRKRFFAKS